MMRLIDEIHLKLRKDNNVLQVKVHRPVSYEPSASNNFALAEIQSKPNKPLGNIAGFSKEQRDPASQSGETFRYIEISGVNRYAGEITANDTPKDEAPSRARMLVREGDIIVSLTRPHHGSIAYIDSEFDNCIASTGFAVIHEYKESTPSPHYLLAILRSSLSGPVRKYGDVSRASRRTGCKARGGRIPGVFNRRATPQAGMHRRPNAIVFMNRST
jgi:hypothetical protein